MNGLIVLYSDSGTSALEECLKTKANGTDRNEKEYYPEKL